MKDCIAKLLVVLAMVVLVTPIGGCPPPTDGNTTDGTTDDTQNTATGDEVQTDFTVTQTAIPVRFDASLDIGDDLIVFGTGTVTGVSYVVPSTKPAAATAIPGDFASSGFAIVDKKVLLLRSDFHVTVYDTATGTSAEIPSDQVSVPGIPDDESSDIFSPVVADGTLAITQSESDQVTDGRILKVIDVSGAAPVITALNNPPVSLSQGVAQIVISSRDQLVIAYTGDKFFVYDLTNPTSDPRTIDLTLLDGIHGPFTYDNGYVLYVAKSTTQNMRLLKVADGTQIPLTKNPGQRDYDLVVRGGKFAYYLERNAYDTYLNVYRAAVGTVPGPDATEGGSPGADPRTRTHPWAGYGNDAAITPNGQWTFISGDQDINIECEFLQVSTGGAFKLFANGTGFLNASDVTASDKLVAFKLGANQATTLGYIVLP